MAEKFTQTRIFIQVSYAKLLSKLLQLLLLCPWLLFSGAPTEKRFPTCHIAAMVRTKLGDDKDNRNQTWLLMENVFLYDTHIHTPNVKESREPMSVGNVSEWRELLTTKGNSVWVCSDFSPGDISGFKF